MLVKVALVTNDLKVQWDPQTAVTADTMKSHFILWILPVTIFIFWNQKLLYLD